MSIHQIKKKNQHYECLIPSKKSFYDVVKSVKWSSKNGLLINHQNKRVKYKMCQNVVIDIKTIEIF